MSESGGLDYRAAGVDPVTEGAALSALAERVRRTFRFAGEPGHPGAVFLDLGYYANVVEIGGGMGIAVSTDGVGTKLLVAEMMAKYDTVGIDCVAMNVNDILCVGARPLALLDYIAVERAEPAVLAAIADGLVRGAEQAGVSIPGGELAQVAEMVRGVEPGSGFDIVGTAIGVVPLDRVIVGAGLTDEDVVLGVPSSGIHSNGLSLARKALFEVGGYGPDDHVDELGRSVGEELLEPTRIYVRPVLALLSAVAGVKALAHITGNGFLNLLRVESKVGFDLDALPEPQPIFRLIQRTAGVAEAEMYRVFNMGIGLCAVVPGKIADRAVSALRSAGADGAAVIGRVRTDRPGEVLLSKQGLVGTEDGGFGAAPRPAV
jgi:phosphoribosylformylglycinamidine cyclo-ligase